MISSFLDPDGLGEVLVSEAGDSGVLPQNYNFKVKKRERERRQRM